MDSPSDPDTRVLVTGAAGFTGRYVCSELERRGLACVGWGTGRRQVDLTDRAAVHLAVSEARPDYVIHLAAVSFVAHEDVEAIYRTNVLGTRHLLEGLSLLPDRPRHIILASSASVYGNVEGRVDESARPAPANDYAVSKLAMEYVASLWTELPITIVRPFNYTGIGQDERFLIPKIVAHFRRRAGEIELGNIDVTRDFNDVRNVAEIYADLLLRPGGAACLNICSGTENSLSDVIEILAGISGHSMQVKVNPKFVRPNDVRRLVGDPSRMLEAAGARRMRPLASTLRWMYESP